MKLSEKLFAIAKSPLGDLVVGVAFGKLSSVLPINRIKENDLIIAFWHPKPFWENHILIVPKKAIKSVTYIETNDYPYIEEVFKIVKEIVIEQQWEDKPYSLIVNGGSRQEVNQLHFHLCCGKELDTSV